MANTSNRTRKYQLNGRVITVSTMKDGAVEAIVRQRTATGVVRRMLARIPANRNSAAVALRRGAQVSFLGAYGEQLAPNPGFKTGLQIFNVYGAIPTA